MLVLGLRSSRAKWETDRQVEGEATLRAAPLQTRGRRA